MDKYQELYNQVETLQDWVDLFQDESFEYDEFLLSISDYKEGDECFRVLGNIGGDWQFELDESDLIASYDSIYDNKYVLKSERSTFEKYNYNYGYNKYAPNELSSKIADALGFKNHVHNINNQPTGCVVNLHVDSLTCWSLDYPDYSHLKFDKKLRQPADHPTLHRVFVALSDWQPGWMWQFGHKHWTGWKKGDVVWFDWRHVPHSTANGGYSARPILKISGQSSLIDKILLDNKPINITLD